MDKMFDKFASIFPMPLQVEVRKNVYIAGGAIVNFLLGVPVADYDLFIVEDAVRDSMRAWFKEQEWNDESRGWRIKAMTENGVTLDFGGDLIYQVVTRFTGKPERVFKSFDFEHCKAFYVPASQHYHANEDLILNKKLVYTGDDDYPLNTMKRLIKFIRRGWDIDNENVLNLAKKMSRTNLDDPAVYKEQTIGFYGSSMY
jgi:hypothetical protein